MCACENFGMDFQSPRTQSFPLFCVGKLEQSVRFVQEKQPAIWYSG